MQKDFAPQTRAFYIELSRFLRSRGITQDQFRIALNIHLPLTRQIPPNHVGAVTISKWLSTTGKRWNEPKSEITEAAKKALQTLKKTNK